MKNATILASCLLAVLVSVSSPLVAQGELGVGPEDLLQVSVFEMPELAATVRVSETGMITLPLLGEIRADGLTPRQLEVTLERLLSASLLKDPQVSVLVREYGSKKVSILGAVGRPGVYEMTGPRNLLQVLSVAGGLTAEAGQALFIIRAGAEEKTERISVSIHDLLVDRDSRANHAIQAGDIISVPLEPLLYVFVDGAVRTPGRLESPASQPLSLLQAMASAGGPTERANLKVVRILRKQGDGLSEAFAANLKRIRKGKDVDPILQNGDVVVVAETFF